MTWTVVFLVACAVGLVWCVYKAAGEACDYGAAWLDDSAPDSAYGRREGER